MATIDVYKEWLGIPEGERPPGQYALLRLVPFEDDPDKIRANYKKLNAHVRKYATGKYQNESQELLNELAKAMLCLTDVERKRDYDESQGREFEDDADPFGRKPTEKALVDGGHITRDQAKEVVKFAEARGLSVRDAAVQMEFVDHDTAARAYAIELGLSYVDLEDVLPEDDVLDGLPRNVVKRNAILPLFVDDGRLLVACVDMPEPELEEELRLRYDVPMRAVIAAPRAIQQAIAKYYAPGARDESGGKPVTRSKGTTAKKGGGEKKTRSAAQSAKPMSQLTDNEKAERRNLGIVFICWAIILPVVVENYLIKPFVPSYPMLSDYVPISFLTVLITPAVICWVLFTYWKK